AGPPGLASPGPRHGHRPLAARLAGEGERGEGLAREHLPDPRSVTARAAPATFEDDGAVAAIEPEARRRFHQRHARRPSHAREDIRALREHLDGEDDRMITAASLPSCVAAGSRCRGRRRRTGYGALDPVAN